MLPYKFFNVKIMDKDKIDFYFRVLERYDNYINLANIKASNSITLIGSFTIAATTIVGWGLFGENKGTLSLNSTNTIIIISFIAFLFFAFMGYLEAMKVVQPNTKDLKDSKNKTFSNIDEKDLSTIFYGHVNNFKTLQSFQNEVKSKDAENLLKDLLSQVRTLSEITTQKMEDCKSINKWILSSFITILIILLFSFINKMG
ncbi:Uncharacterised protein [Acinetobacter baumannii]|nr:Uncharacterised protein [Acinetobacter baumannii]SSV88763.1 Uncharacterised protein [Acinetobacter baumannii]SSV93483.1 Uncharacterised protein [Acinetobacter baumannii]SSW14565.1 Uncharacterised protein [Acinetobacter baumannii]